MPASLSIWREQGHLCDIGHSAAVALSLHHDAEDMAVPFTPIAREASDTTGTQLRTLSIAFPKAHPPA